MKWLKNWTAVWIACIICLLICSAVEAKKSKNRVRFKAKNNSTVEEEEIFSPWTRWSRCSRRCTQKRTRRCIHPIVCDRDVLKEQRVCKIARCLFFRKTTNRKNTSVELDAMQERNGNLEDELWILNRVQRRRQKSGVNTETSKIHLLNRFHCGISPIAERSPEIWKHLRIIGGREAQKGSWPWQLALLNRYREPFCGATLIAPKWALTAAHCLRRKLIVRSGEHNLMSIEGTEQESLVVEQYVHPDYDEATVHNDVALLKLKKPFIFDNHTQAACLPQQQDSLDVDSKGIILGWGKHKSTAIYGTDDLHQAEVPIVDPEECQKSYDTYPITQTVICAGYKQGRVDSCAGDSGGPLLVQKKGRWTLFGVTSFGDGCGEKGKYGIYSSVPKYVKWIRRVVFKHS
ncbi:plasma kallikrein-like [Argiope bruennichi]|uniref:plasma kallikrein-like n=1 Tax=Argiope bruennichi TaxID=94029 RepID=UPI0024947CCF|nr:plasma kallikrein-like [Argiope bruennichi]XP_055945567.1 plasma kallikrein-like [Argiope bruennichi]XP_055945573.1 plasma kallikrein-like [Argiope bruennichi]